MTVTENGVAQKTPAEHKWNKEDGIKKVTAYVTLPPDGGWGWVIVAASFFCNIVADGTVFSFGVFLIPMAEDFGESPSKVAIASALLSGFYLLSGPFVSAIANRYGFRFTGIAGAVVGSLSFAAASFAPSIEAFWIIYGFFGGIGFGMIYVPAVVTTGFYFQKWRAIATGVCVTGSGIGTVIMGPISSYLINCYGWRGALLIQAGLALNCAICAALYRPLKPILMSVNNNQSEEDAEKTEVPLLHRIKMARDEIKKTESIDSVTDEVEITAMEPFEARKKFLKATNNILYPRAIDALHNSSSSIQSKSSMELKYNRKKKEPRVKYDNNLTITVFTGGFEKHLLIPAYTLERKSQSVEYDPLDMLLNEQIHDDVLYTPKKTKEVNHNRRRGSISIKYRRRADSVGSFKLRKNNHLSRSGVRPFYKDDIFFQGSLARFPQYNSQGSNIDYAMSVTRLPTTKDVQEEEEGVCQLCPEAVRRTLATMLDPSLLSSPSFMIFAFSGFLTTLGLFTPFLYIAERGRVNGMDSSVLMYLVSLIGITNTLGRIMCGLLTMLPQISGLMVTNIGLTIGGIVTIASGLSYDNAYQISFALIFGLAVSIYGSLRSIIAVDLVGLEKLTNAFGFLLLFQGFAAIMGAPIAGLIVDYTGDYDAAFYLAGILILLSGIICYPLTCIKKWEEKRKLRKLFNLI